MKPLLLPRLVLSLALLILAPAVALHAQATKIFVASYGNDANDGSRGAPKRNFQAAHDAVAAGGEIVVLDTAGYGALNITKSLAVTVPPGVNGFVTVGGNANGIVISASAGDAVNLRGLIVEGGGNTGSGSGILINSLGSLSLEDCTVRNFYLGLNFLLSTSANVSLDNSILRGCAVGASVETNANNVTVVMVLTDCHLDQNIAYGLQAAPGAGGTTDVTLANCVISGNATGIDGNGPNALVRLSNCTLTSNGTGVLRDNNAQVLSRTNNTLENNSGGNTFAASYSAK